MPLLPYLSGPIVQQLAGVVVRGGIQTYGLYRGGKYIYQRRMKRTVSGAYKAPSVRMAKNKYGYKGKGALASRVRKLEVNFPHPAVRVLTLTGSSSIGQSNGDSQAAVGTVITPVPTVGTGVTQRQGDEIFVRSMYITLQMISQFGAATLNVPMSERLLHVEVYRVPDSGFNDVARLYLPNPQTGLVDFYSARNQEFAEHYVKLYDQVHVLTAPNTLGNPAVVASAPHCVNFGLKFPKPLKVDFDSGGTTVTLGAILLIVRPSWGNSSGTDATLASLLSKPKSTGINMFIGATAWYTC